MIELRRLENQIHTWQTEQWPDADSLDKLRKVHEELGELSEALARWHQVKFLERPPEAEQLDEEDRQVIAARKDHLAAEAADVVIALLGLLRLEGLRLSGGVLQRVLQKRMARQLQPGSDYLTGARHAVQAMRSEEVLLAICPSEDPTCNECGHQLKAAANKISEATGVEVTP